MSNKYLDDQGMLRTRPRKQMKGTGYIGQAFFIPEDMIPYPYEEADKVEEVDSLDAGYKLPLIKKEDLPKVLEEQKKIREGQVVDEKDKIRTETISSSDSDLIELITEEGTFLVTPDEFREIFGKDISEVQEDDEMFLGEPEEIDLTKL